MFWPFRKQPPVASSPADSPSAAPEPKVQIPPLKFAVDDWVKYQAFGTVIEGKIRHAFPGNGSTYANPPRYVIMGNGRVYADDNVYEKDIIEKINAPTPVPQYVHVIVVTLCREIQVQLRPSWDVDYELGHRALPKQCLLIYRSFATAALAYDYLFTHEEEIISVDRSLHLGNEALAEKVTRKLENP